MLNKSGRDVPHFTRRVEIDRTHPANLSKFTKHVVHQHQIDRLNSYRSYQSSIIWAGPLISIGPGPEDGQARIGRFQTESSGKCRRELDCEIDEREVSRF